MTKFQNAGDLEKVVLVDIAITATLRARIQEELNNSPAGTTASEVIEALLRQALEMPELRK